MSDSLCDEVDLSQFCQHVRLLFLVQPSCNISGCSVYNGSISSGNSSHSGNDENVIHTFEKSFNVNILQYFSNCLNNFLHIQLF